MTKRARLSAAIVIALVAGLLAAGTEAAHGVVPGMNGKIVFVSDRNGNTELYSMNADGTGASRLTFTAENEDQPAVSPDGKKVAFLSDRGGFGAQIWLMGIDGSNPIRLTDDRTGIGNPTWSPDGTKIAFETSRTGLTVTIWVMDADGSNPRKVIDRYPYANVGDPAWSPDGTKLAYVAQSSRILMASAADGSGEVVVADSPVQAILLDPAWSPDGATLAYHYYPATGVADIYTVDIGTGVKTNLTSDAALDQEPAWSPDGTQIAYAANIGGEWEVFRMNADGSGKANLNESDPRAHDRGPDWGAGEPVPALSIDGSNVTEGNAGTTSATFTLSLSAPSSVTVTVDYTTADGSATAGSDYSATSGTVTFAPGDTSETVAVSISGDLTFEPDETFQVTLSNPQHATIASGSAVSIIQNDDPVPSIVIGDGSASEGASGTAGLSLVVSLSNPSSADISVDYTTADVTATAGSDYAAVPLEHLTIGAGVTSKAVVVAVQGDTVIEPDETFEVHLSNAANATIADGTGVATIVNDDAAPGSLSVDDLSVGEGDSGATAATFTVTLSPAQPSTVTVDYASADGTATAGSDYSATSGTVTFTPGETRKSVAVPIIGDTSDEPDETFTVTLSNGAGATIADAQGVGTIRDDDPTPAIYIVDEETTEADSGTIGLPFTVFLTGASAQTVTVDYTTADGTALAGSDYSPASGTLTFAPGDVVETITVFVTGDTAVEADETFFVDLANPTNATIGFGQATGTIANDDVASISIADASQVEGDSQNSTLLFELTLSQPLAQTVTVQCGTTNGTATGGVDYASGCGTATFAPGATTAWVGVSIVADTIVEGDETFFVDLSNPANAVIADGRAVGTVADDDGGYLVITPVDEVGKPVVGACYEIYKNFDPFTQTGTLVTTTCDSHDGANDGRIVPAATLAPDNYLARPLAVPTGYFKNPFGATVIITAGQTTTTSPLIPRLAYLTINSTDERGQPLRGAYYSICWCWFGIGGSPSGRPATFTLPIPAGTPLGVLSASPPPGYLPAPSQGGIPAVPAGTTLTRTYSYQPRLRITPIDEVGNPVLDACYELLANYNAATGSGTVVATRCDRDDGANDGRIVPTVTLAPGSYFARPTAVPTGYFKTPFGATITIPANQTATVTVTPTIPRVADLTINSTDESGALLEGACYVISWNTAAVGFSPRSCPSTFTRSVPAGTQLQVEQVATPPGYLPEPNQTITVAAGQTALLTFEHTPE